LDDLEKRLPSEPSAAETGALMRAFETRSYSDLERIARRLTEAYPGSVVGWKALGLALLTAGKPQEALPALERSIELRHDDPEVFTYLGNACNSLGLIERAETAYRQAIELRTGAAEPQSGLGRLLFAQKRYGEAEAHFRQAVEARPLVAEHHVNLGATLGLLGRLEQAEASLRRALSLDPGSANCHYNLGKFLQDAGRLEEAESPYRRVLELDPSSLFARNNLAETFVERGLHGDALALLCEALERNPDYATARWNKSLVELRRGNFADGWRDYELRWRYQGFPTPKRDLPQPLWLGEEPIAGKTIAVVWEQGLGDTIQFCRYLPMLADRGAKVAFAPQGNLKGLMSGLAGNIELVDLDEVLRGRHQCDYQVPLLSLPLAFRTDAGSIPAAIPYLRSEPDRKAHWRERIGDRGFKIGICWQGQAGKEDRGRSFPLACLAGVGRLPGVRLISLHKGAGEAQLASLPDGMRVETFGEDFDAGPEAFLDTAAVMELCDLVITSDTAVAHLAGALGVRTWVALKVIPDWRWMRGRQDSPWYPSVRLFRQKSRGSWSSVFEEIEAAARALPVVIRRAE